MKTPPTRSSSFARRATRALALALFGVLSGSSLAQDEPPAKLTGSSMKCKPDVVVYRGTYPGWPWVTDVAGQARLCVA